MPASVGASLYLWNVDANGSWTTASNWLYAGGGPNTGHPNAPGDQAFFTAEYTAARTVTIPAGVTVTVWAIYFGTPHRIDVVGAGSSRVALNNGLLGAVDDDQSYAVFLPERHDAPSQLGGRDRERGQHAVSRADGRGRRRAHVHEARERNDREIVTDYFRRAGATIRSSPAWKAEYASDGRPGVLRTGRFGVGALAAFLLGDEIHVTPRRIGTDRGLSFTA